MQNPTKQDQMLTSPLLRPTALIVQIEVARSLCVSLRSFLGAVCHSPHTLPRPSPLPKWRVKISSRGQSPSTVHATLEKVQFYVSSEPRSHLGGFPKIGGYCTLFWGVPLRGVYSSWGVPPYVGKCPFLHPRLPQTRTPTAPRPLHAFGSGCGRCSMQRDV